MTNDARATVVLLHESGHGMQERAGIDPVTPSLLGSAEQLKPLELSADCWAGVGIAYLIKNRDLPPGALRQARSVFVMSGDAVHGNAFERGTSFTAGYRRGPAACNEIVGRPVFG
ncbi:MAG: hypothetical protein QM809_00325 [Gordonia sp. (in: high G+C Gram-positive bacteria)]|uniref:hypothetical protein n=1 Tax=Gordonia sp. (in: high G+C Gram-positive bacteria) TaxID=84139 RepID=UPI0039E6E0FC